MAQRTDFTAEEWEQLQLGVTGAGLLVSLSDRSFFDSFREAGALGRHLAEARRDNPSELVRELAEIHGTGFGVRTSPGEVEQRTLAALGAGTATLQAKAPDEVDGYRRFVLDVAQSVAAAAGGVAGVESDAIAKIRSALGA